MTSTNVRSGLLVAIAAALVSGVLGIQLANGGGDFAPTPAADPCAARVVRSVSSGIDGLTERLVLLGLDGASCRLGVTREAFTFELAQPGPPTDREVNAVRAGLLAAVERMKRDGTLPPASALTDEALDAADLPGFVKGIIRALPDSLVDGALKTDDVLRHTIENLDMRAVLENLRDPGALSTRINDAVTEAVKQALVDRLKDLL